MGWSFLPGSKVKRRFLAALASNSSAIPNTLEQLRSGFEPKGNFPQHTSQDWLDWQSLAGFLTLPPLQMWLQLLSGW